MFTAASVMISGSGARHVHHEAVADAARGPEPRLALHHRAHQLVGMEAALHQGFGLGVREPAPPPWPPTPGCTRRSTMRNREMSSPELAATLADPRGGPDEDRCDQPDEGGVDRAAERGLVAGVSDRRGRGRNRLATGDQPVVLLVRRFHVHALYAETTRRPSPPRVGSGAWASSPGPSHSAGQAGRSDGRRQLSPAPQTGSVSTGFSAWRWTPVRSGRSGSASTIRSPRPATTAPSKKVEPMACR